MDVGDQETAELLRALLEELGAMREETRALLEEMLRKLDSIDRSQHS
jgi:hypothetical protein